MSARKRIFHKCVALLSLAILAIAPGCKLGAFFGGRAGLPVGYAGPSVAGRWTGRIVRMDLYDIKGRRYVGPALEIISGPLMPGGIHEQLGGGKLPILAERHGDGYSFKQVEFAEGTLVEITGTMVSELLHVNSEPHQNRVMVSRLRANETYNEHLLVVRGNATKRPGNIRPTAVP